VSTKRLYSSHQILDSRFLIGSDFAYQTAEDTDKFLAQAGKVLLGAPNRMAGELYQPSAPFNTMLIESIHYAFHR
jgi:hypothetical protein